ncbi:MAG: hypothetical protein JNG84_01635, partial [Archangium sp.]|nr:hypothetical protein [Archangium sp.]
MSAPPTQRLRPAHWVALGGWGALCAWCVGGFPPCVDLPAHGAQLQTLAGLVRGDDAVSALYEVRPSIGYGLPYWLFLPAALGVDGAFAARVAMGLALFLTVVSVASLLRALGRPVWAAVLAAPTAFGFTYWYGLVPAFFAQPMLLFACAAFARAQRAEHPRRWWVLCGVAATATLLSHVVVFAALAVALVAWALAENPRRWLPPTAGALLVPCL